MEKKRKRVCVYKADRIWGVGLLGREKTRGRKRKQEMAWPLGKLHKQGEGFQGNACRFANFAETDCIVSAFY